MPAELDELTRKVTRLEIEEAALSKETDAASKARLEELRKELQTCGPRPTPGTLQWEAERQAIRRVQELRGELERLRHEAEEAERNYDLNRAAELRYGEITALSAGSRRRRSNWLPGRAGIRCCVKWSPKTRSQRSWPHGRVSRSPGCRKVSGRSC